jgi:hypothetical protein
MTLSKCAVLMLLSSVLENIHASTSDIPHPLIFTGGVGASMLQANLNKTASPHWFCDKQYKGYDLWLYYTNLAPMKADCWLDNMRLRWEDGKMQDAGIDIVLVGDNLKAGDNVNTGFAKDLWSDLISGVSGLGYSGSSPHVSALHYDWRLSLDQLIKDGSFTKMKQQIEARVTAAHGKRAVLVTLSYGGPLMHKFLAKFVDAAWKQKYIERWVSLSGVWGGSVELTRMAFFPEPKDFFNIPEFLPYISLEAARDMSNTFPSSFTLRPTFMKSNEVLVSAQIAGQKHKYGKDEISPALADSGLLAAKQVYDVSRNAYSFHHLGEPGVEVDCIYGIGDDTVNGVHFGNGFNKPATNYTFEDGDGVAPRRSLSLCGEWSRTSVHTFPGIGHGGTLHSKPAVQRFARIMQSLQGRQPAPIESSIVV